MKEIVLKNGEICILDEDDFDYISSFKWQITSNKKYASGWVDGKVRLMHRVILDMKDSKLEVDHINGNGFDNRKSNLRACTRQQNSFNAKGKGLSKYKGVYWCTKTNRWRAQIKGDGKNRNLGRFLIEKDAAIAYDKGAIKYFGEYARLNFPETSIRKE